MRMPRDLFSAVLAGIFAFAAPASGQLLADFGLGQYDDDAGDHSVVEFSLAAVAGPVIPNLLLTFHDDGSGMPVIQPQLGRVLARTPMTELMLDVGYSAGPSDDYAHWEPHFAVSTNIYLLGPVKASLAVAWQPRNQWAQISVVKFAVGV